MLEHLDLSQKLSKKDWKAAREPLQHRLFNLAHACRRAKQPICVVFEGWYAAGKGACIKFITERQDPRGFRVERILEPRTYEQGYPWMRRFWLRIPRAGETVIFDTSWYRRVLWAYIEGRVTKKQVWEAYHDIVDFERTLTDDGTLIVKFWLHISQKEQKHRLKELKENPIPGFPVTKKEWGLYKVYDELYEAVERMLKRTESAAAPWNIIAASDQRYTQVQVMRTLIQAVESRLHERGVNIQDNYALHLDAISDPPRPAKRKPPAGEVEPC